MPLLVAIFSMMAIGVAGGHAIGVELLGVDDGSYWSQINQAMHGGDIRDMLIKGAVFMSGLGDLEPVRLSFRNAYLKLDPAMVARTSLLACPHAPCNCPLLVMVAGLENDEYKRQGKAVAQYWANLGRPSRFMELAGCNHFNGVLAWLERPDFGHNPVADVRDA